MLVEAAERDTASAGATARVVRLSDFLLVGWQRYGTALLILATLLMAVVAFRRLSWAFPHLLGDVAEWSALDLRNRYAEVQRWAAGLPVYGAMDNADYPPASYALLWPLLGWLPLEGARALWAVTSLAGMLVLAGVAVRAGLGTGTLDRGVAVPALFLALLVFSTYPAEQTILVGQLGIHVLGLVLAGTLLLRARADWRSDLLATTLLVPALVKPTLAAPFFWIVLFVPGRVRPALLIVIAYVALTLVGAGMQPDGLTTLIPAWLQQAGAEVTVLEGLTNVHKWLALAGLANWSMLGSLALLVGLGVWTWRYRQADRWLLLAVAALVARLWVHHRPYDDILMLVPAITLFRLSRSEGRWAVGAGVLFGALWASLHLPISFFYETSAARLLAVEIGQTALWLGVFVFLIQAAHRYTRSTQPGIAGT